jgi:hypothetical protein
VWRQFREQWRTLPAHTRKGLLRLYIATSALWTVYFGYQVVLALDIQRYGVWRYVSGPLWTMLIAPIGAQYCFSLPFEFSKGSENLTLRSAIFAIGSQLMSCSDRTSLHTNISRLVAYSGKNRRGFD